MGQRIPEQLINEVKSKTEIVDVIGEYVQLRKQGRNYLGLCPFHGEKTPSFSVAPEKQIFHCFGCGTGGNVFTFLMDIEGITFVEAVKKLADKVAIPLEINVENVTPENDFSDMLAAHELLKNLYHHVLINTKQGQTALEYLLARGMTMDSIMKFEIGYAFDHHHFQTDFLRKRGFDLERMVLAGLLVKSNDDSSNQSYFDRFRHRIMFPIGDHQGRTIAFSGRSLDADKMKYMNSPETPLFNKSKILYNYYRARPIIRKKDYVVLFEGFLDVISADRAQVDNAIATMGTAFSEEHLQILKRVTNQFIICFDGDSAGIQAANKTADLIYQTGSNCKISILDDGYDPDEYIKEKGAERFQKEIIHTARTFIAFKMYYHRRGRNFENEAEKMAYIETILEEIAKVRSDVEREYYLRKIAQEFSLSIETLLNQEKRLVNRFRRQNQSAEKTFAAELFIKQKEIKDASRNAEENLISYMLKDKTLSESLRNTLGEDFLNNPDHQSIITQLFSYYQEGYTADPSLFINYLQEPKLRRIVTEIEMKTLDFEPSEQEIEDYIQQFQRKIKEKKLEDLILVQKEAEGKNNFQLAAKIAVEILEIKKTL